MRQKKLKGITKELLISKGVLTNRELIDFSDYQEKKMEIGSGKGKFITSLAADNKKIAFIAVEKNTSVCYRIVEKKEELKLDNLFIILDDANYLETYFKENSIDTIYLNFSDPWPKAKHHKRRLTANKFLNMYYALLKKNGILQFRTDHLDFFNDSIEYFKTSRFVNVDINFDLPISTYMTEYEIKKRRTSKIYELRGEKIG